MVKEYGIVGFGRSGQAVAAWCQRHDHSYLIYDDQPLGLPESWSGSGLPDISSVSQWVVSPGVPPRHPLVTAIAEAGLVTQTDVGLFCDIFTGPIVGVTGTNGKTTVAEMTAHRIAAAGLRCVALGNTGRSPLDFLEENLDVAVLELSSFQLYYSPELPITTACLTNLAADHLDWHRDQTEYFAAKAKIFSHADFAVVNTEDVDAVAMAQSGSAVVLQVSTGQEVSQGLRWQGHHLFWQRDGVCETVETGAWQLRGKHNRMNAGMALSVGVTLGLDLDSGMKALHDFQPGKHRLQRVRTVEGVEYIDDSKATNPHAVAAALSSVLSPVVLVAGGVFKGGNFADALVPEATMRAVILYGRDAALMAQQVTSDISVTVVDTLDEALVEAHNTARSGDVVLLSPACASFDQFNSYQERGNHFCQLVEHL